MERPQVKDEQTIGLLEHYSKSASKTEALPGVVSDEKQNLSSPDELQDVWIREDKDEDLPVSRTHTAIYWLLPVKVRKVLDYVNTKASDAIDAEELGSAGNKTFGSLVISFAISLLPSFIVPIKSSHTPKKIHPTAWLDGLRGVCALFVVFAHWILMFNRDLVFSEDPEYHSILQWPFIRVIYAGSGAVGIFFIVSGYALSYRALQLMRKGDTNILFNSLSSTTFRRCFRLFIPMNISSFMSMLMVYANWYGKGPGLVEPPHFLTFWPQLKNWMWDAVELSDPFLPLTPLRKHDPYYDGNTWTIPAEIRGSILVFVILLGLARIKTPIRIGTLIALTAFCQWRQYIQYVLFIGGIAIADLGLLYGSSKNDSISLGEEPTPEKRHPILHKIKNVCLSVMFVLSIYFVGIPAGRENQMAYGYGILLPLTPSSYASEHFTVWFWINVGSFMCVFSLQFALFLQKIFTTRIALYLGKVSYSLYLMHVKFLFTFGCWFLPKVLDFTGRGTQLQRFVGHIFAGSVTFFVIFWAADLFTRGVDEKLVKSLRWLSQSCSS